MKPLLMLLVALVAAIPAAQEQHTPPGDWCQRPPIQSQHAHECACHQHDCSDPDPDHVSAHHDTACKNYCNVHSCMCAKMDCP